MRVLINVLLAIVVVVFVTVVVFLIVTMRGGSDDKPETEATATTKAPIRYMSTGGVADNIERRLEAKAGIPLTAKCPKKVNQAIGTTFRCRVLPEGGSKTLSVADVTIDGPGGEFSWTSSSKPLATPTPADGGA